MTRSAPSTIELQPELDDQVAAIAASLDRPKSWVVEQAVREFLAVRDWQAAAIDEGLREADAGQVFEHDQVAEWVASWDGPDEKPMPTRR
ncbi:MAG: CopG family ribbon-helix-helix protein [bacterium]|nr:CopG family ribbon-helix-helix protein [bacterium]